MAVQMELTRIIINENNEQQIIFLKEVDGDRTFPIVIGLFEATSIERRVKQQPAPRPLTHDLLKNVIEATGHSLTEIRITDMQDGIYYATLAFESGVEVSARPSDSIALALRTGTRIVCSEELLDATGIEVPDEQEDEVEKFREFLDQVTPDDFEEL